MVFADTGFWIGLLQTNDALHRQCLGWWAAVGPQVVTSEYVMIETLAQLAAPSYRRRAVSLMDSVFESPNGSYLPASPDLFTTGLDLYRSRPDKAWSLTDCISFEIMSDRAITDALAYDRHFEQAGFRALLREDPPGAGGVAGGGA